MTTISILGVPISCTNYESAIDEAIRLANSGGVALISACNTHLVSHSRLRPSFDRVLKDFDMNLPDGTHLIWVARHKGQRLSDRVYGPYFMQHCIRRTPRPWRHFFLGGTQLTLTRLQSELYRIQPQINIAGAFSPPFNSWTPLDEANCLQKINESRADFVWVALGGIRQETWLSDNRVRFRKGVFVAIGDGFELLAGTRPFAPKWMQRSGLTWLFRLWLEPGRLWKRYLFYNPLFLWYVLKEELFKSRR